MSSSEYLKKQIESTGYAVINVNDTYYYTVGFGLQHRFDLIGFPHYPFSLFQIAASLHSKRMLEVGKTFLVNEIKVPGLGMEPSRCKLAPLDINVNGLVLDFLAKVNKDYNPIGFGLVLGPDKDNITANDPGSLIQFNINGMVRDFVGGVKTDIETAVSDAKKILSLLKA